MAPHSVHLFEPSHLPEWSRRISCNALFGQYYPPTLRVPNPNTNTYFVSRIESRHKKSILPCVCMLSFLHFTAFPASCSSNAGSRRVCASLQVAVITYNTLATATTPSYYRSVLPACHSLVRVILLIESSSLHFLILLWTSSNNLPYRTE